MRVGVVVLCGFALGCSARPLEISTDTVETSVDLAVPDLGTADGHMPHDLSSWPHDLSLPIDLSSQDLNVTVDLLTSPDFASPPDLSPPHVSWFNMSLGLPPGQIDAVAADPTNAGIAYVATYGGGVEKTVDSGAHWQASSMGLLTMEVWTVVVDPANTLHLFAGTTLGLFESNDAGAHWFYRDYGGPGHTTDVEHIVFDPGQAHVVYLLDPSLGGPVYRSTDSGAHWASLGTPVTKYLEQLTIDPASSSHMYLTAGWQIWESHDTGGSWTQLATQPATATEGVYGVAYDPAQHTLCANSPHGTSISTNDGASWTVTLPYGTFGLGGNGPVFLPGRGFYAHTQNGLYHSTDCVTWTSLMSVIGGRQSISMDGSGVVYTVTSTAWGVWRSGTDGLTGWTEADEGIDNTEVVELRIDPVAPANLYVTLAAWTDPLYRTSDGASSWQFAAVGPIINIASNGNELIGSAYPHLYRSFDHGVTWETQTISHELVSFAFDPTDPLQQKLFAAVDDYSISGAPMIGIYASSDEGASFAPQSTATFYGYRIVADATHPGRLWVRGETTTTSGLYRSDDSGTTWNPIATPRSVATFAVAPSNGDTLYAVSEGPAPGVAFWVYRSVDGGASWTTAAQTTPNGIVSAIIVDPSDEQTVYLATAGNGVIVVVKSSDGGASWRSANDGLPGMWIGDFAIDPTQPQTIYAGTNAGVWKSTTGGE
jgi:photosystem II stability/assembly factor-like uncharacterized protein